MLRILLVCMSILAVRAYHQQDGVLILSDSDLQKVTDEFKHILIAYLEPESKACQELTVIIQQIAKEFQQKQSPMRLATINCDQNPQSFQFGQLRAIPTLIYYQEGYPNKFQGYKTKRFLQKWLTKQVSSAVQQINKTELEALRESDSEIVSIVFIGSIRSVRGHQFTELADSDPYNDYYFIEEEVQLYGTVLLLRSFAQDLLYASFDEDVYYWIAKNDRANVVPFDSRSMNSVFKQGRTGILFFIEQDYNKMFSIFNEAAKEWKAREKTAISISFITVTPEYKHYDNFVEYMRIETRKQPLVIVNGAMETKYVLKQKVSRVTTRSILQFLEGYDKGTVRELPLSPHAQPPEEEQQEQRKSEEVEEEL